ncbi:hypothetical protein ACP70R_015571 [Stipagrostis hirtigluma subsp. patula]
MGTAGDGGRKLVFLKPQPSGVAKMQDDMGVLHRMHGKEAPTDEFDATVCDVMIKWNSSYTMDGPPNFMTSLS